MREWTTIDEMPLNTNGYTREEVFAFLTMQLGSPPKRGAARYRGDPGLEHLIRKEHDYYNEVTSWLMKLLPERGIADIVELRRQYYSHHGMMLFDTIANEYDLQK